MLYFQASKFYSLLQSIGHAYEDIMSQNQQLLQQIIERDDHNTKVMIQRTNLSN
jgi:E3 ubiquitin-protein ligase BRE1